jgi:hypothetical protein
MKGIQKLESEGYKTRGGKYNFRIIAHVNFQKNPICLVCNPQGYNKKSECEEMAKAWTYKGQVPEFVWLRKYYRLS